MLLELLAALVGSLGFAALFNLHGKKLALSALGGAPAGFGAALGVAPDMHALDMPQIFVAGKAPVQQAMIDVLDALGVEGARPVEASLSAHMGVEGAAAIAL